MTWEVEISNGAANVIKFIIIEFCIALLLEPAVAEFNRIRAKNLVSAGKPVHIRTHIVTRDFSGPVVGGKLGALWKLFLFVLLLGSLLSTEFAFDYDVRQRHLGNKISLKGLSAEALIVDTGDTSKDLDGMRNMSEDLYKLLKCSRLSGNTRQEVRLRPDGECYTGESDGLSFPEPCALSAGDNHDFQLVCIRTEEGIAKVKSINYSSEYREVWDADATYMLLGRRVSEESKYYGSRDKNGKRIRHCSKKTADYFIFDNSSVTLACYETLDSGDGFLSQFDFDNQDNDTTAINSTTGDPQVLGANSAVIRIGANTFSEPHCAGCGIRMQLMLDLFALNMAVRQGSNLHTITPNYDDIGRAVAMLAMGIPAEVGEAYDDKALEPVGILVIDWRFVLPLAIVVTAALIMRVFGLWVRSLIDVPLDYCSAMNAAYEREMAGTVDTSKKQRNSYRVGLVKTSEHGILHLSLNATDVIPYNGEEIRPFNILSEEMKRFDNVDK